MQRAFITQFSEIRTKKQVVATLQYVKQKKRANAKLLQQILLTMCNNP